MRPRRWLNRAWIVLGILLAAIIVGACGSHSEVSKPPLSDSARRSADAKAKAILARALKDIAVDREDFRGYTLVSQITLKNTDRSLKPVSSLTATGTASTFAVSVRSASGTTFAAHGARLALTDTCQPNGPDCRHGRWNGPATLALPPVPELTAAQDTAVRTILEGSVEHYATLFAEGQAALGTTQYASAQAGLAAFADPNSAASKFSAYRKSTGAERDLSYLQAFKKGDSYFTAANEPAAVRDWEDEMGNVGSDLYTWIQDAVSWQIREVSTGKLAADAATFERDLAIARAEAISASGGARVSSHSRSMPETTTSPPTATAPYDNIGATPDRIQTCVVNVVSTGPDTSCAFADHVYGIVSVTFRKTRLLPATVVASSAVTRRTYTLACAIVGYGSELTCTTTTGASITISLTALKHEPPTTASGFTTEQIKKAKAALPYCRRAQPGTTLHELETEAATPEGIQC